MADPADQSNSTSGKVADDGDRIDGLIRDLETRIGGALSVKERKEYRRIVLSKNSGTHFSLRHCLRETNRRELYHISIKGLFCFFGQD